jgi:RNA-directed DNA polymerase
MTSGAFLGCEWLWAKDRAGQAHVPRRTGRQQLRNSLRRFTPWCRENRNLRLGVLWARLHAKLRGYSNDDGVPGNFASLTPVFSQALGLLQT